MPFCSGVGAASPRTSKMSFSDICESGEDLETGATGRFERSFDTSANGFALDLEVCAVGLEVARAGKAQQALYKPSKSAMSIGVTHCSETNLSKTTRRTVMPVPRRAKDRMMRASKRRAQGAGSFLANMVASKPSGMIATSRPPGARRRQAERKCRRAER